MDVFLHRQSNGTCLVPTSRKDLQQSEPLHAQSPLELADEIAGLRKRRVRMVSVRRQQVMRLGQEALQHMLADNGISVGTIGYAGGFTGSLGRGYESAVADILRALELAAALEAKSLVVVPGSQGNHIYNHASRTIRAGLERCLDDALRYRIDLQIAMNNVIGDRDDVFRPVNQSPLQWIEQMESHRMKGLMVLRGESPWAKLPDCWRTCLVSGGILRLSRSCRQFAGTAKVISHIIDGLNDATWCPKKTGIFSVVR